MSGLKLRPVIADLALASRPVLFVVLVLVAALSGLASAVTQDTASLQREAAQEALSQRLWASLPCNSLPKAACQAERRMARADAERFASEQEVVAARVGRLQSASGSLEYAAKAMALGLGAGFVVLVTALFVGGEFRRRTAVAATSRSISPARVALRRACVVWLLSLLGLAAAFGGAGLAAIWGGALRPLPADTSGFPLTTLTGVVLMLGAYSASASIVVWRVRGPVESALLTCGAVAVVAFTGLLGTYGPGRLPAAVVGVTDLLELELGLIWVWPPLTFSPNGGTPTRVVASVSWPVGLVLVGLVTSVLFSAVAREARRSVPT